MATKRELKDRAVSLGAVPEKVERLNHEALTALVAELEAKASGIAPAPAVASPGTEPASPAATGPAGEAPEILEDGPRDLEPPAVPPEEPPSEIPSEGTVLPAASAVLAMREKAARAAPPESIRGSKYKVAPGYTLFCERSGASGLRAGEPIRDADFDSEQLARHLKQGAIVLKSGG